MKAKWAIAAASCALLASCGAKKVAVERKPPTKSVAYTSDLRNLKSYFQGKIPSKIAELIKDAEKYLGAPYKYAGNTSSGFDCSGFTCKVYSENELNLPRRSQDQATTGEDIDVKNIKPGDLIFFSTLGGNRVSHVGIVHDIGEDGEIKFIHASSSKGVVISSLNEKYWNKAFLYSRRVL